MTSYLMNSKNIIIQLTRQTFILLLIVKIQLGLHKSQWFIRLFIYTVI